MLPKTEREIRSLPGNSFLPGSHRTFNLGTNSGMPYGTALFNHEVHPASSIINPLEDSSQWRVKINYEDRALNFDLVSFVGQILTENAKVDESDPIIRIQNQLNLKRRRYFERLVDEFKSLHTGMSDHIDYYSNPEKYSLGLSNPTIFFTDNNLDSITNYLQYITRKKSIISNLGNLIVARVVNLEDLKAPKEWLPFHTGLIDFPTVHNIEELEEFNNFLINSDQKKKALFENEYQRAQVVDLFTDDQGLENTDNALACAINNLTRK